MIPVATESDFEYHVAETVASAANSNSALSPIDNPEIIYELLHFTDNPEILVLSGSDPAQSLLIEPAQLGELYDGTYTGESVYGVAPGEPIAMNVSVLDGEITRTAMVYLP